VHVISLGALISWRLSYFGYPFPNTYYAKVSSNKKDNIVAGLHYIFNFYFLYPHVAFLTGVLLFFGIYFWRKKQSLVEFTSNEKILAILFAVVLAGLGLPVLTGGDHFAFARFYLPFMPLLYLAATDQYLWRNCFGISFQVKKTAAAMLLISFVVAVMFSPKSTLFDFFTHHGLINFPEFDIAVKGRNAAEKLNEAFAAAHSYPSIGSFATGGVGYSYRGKTIDLLGLNSTIMAHASRVKTGIRNHASFDKKAFWILKPDVLGTAYGGEIITDTASFVLYENIPGYRNDNFLYLAYKKIFDDDDFRSAYLPAFVNNKNQDYFIFGYYHRSFLDSLDSSVYGIKLLKRTFNPHGAVSIK
jgi:arabinofuranosyltransferase